MDSDDSFLNMLSVGGNSMNWAGSQQFSPIEEEQMTPTQDSIASVKVKFTKGKNWSMGEDNLLVQTWLHTSLDAVTGNEQTNSSYWGRIFDYYDTNKKSSWSVRNQNSLNCRFSAIQKQVNKFCGCYQSILNRNQSRLTERDKQTQAHALYKSKDPKEGPFTLMHCWNELHKHPKWESHMSSRGSQKKQKKTEVQQQYYRAKQAEIVARRNNTSG